MKRFWHFVIIGFLGLILSLTISIPASSQLNTMDLVREAQQQYQQGNFKSSLTLLSKLEQEFRTQKKPLQQGQIQSLISLNHQQLGNWEQAQKAIDYGLALIATEARTTNKQQVLGQIWNAQGHLHLRQGRSQKAIADWSKAESFYQQINDILALKGIKLGRSQALLDLGFYRRSCDTVLEIFSTKYQNCQQLTNEDLDVFLQEISVESNSLAIDGLSSLANNLMLLGKLQQAQQVVQYSQNLVKKLNSTSSLIQNKLNFTIANIADAKANLARERSNQEEFKRENLKAIAAYQTILEYSKTNRNTDFIEAEIKLLNIYIKSQKWDLARNIVTQNDLAFSEMPFNYRTLKTQLILAGSLTSLKENNVSITRSWDDIGKQYLTLSQKARELGNYRLESSALGYLGELAYRQKLNLNIDPQSEIERALHLAQSNQAPEIAYRWQWQLGKMARDRGDITQAMIAYEAAFNTLQDLRSDLVALEREIQFSFRQQVEPVYREYTKLLLVEQTPVQIATADNLKKARDVIEALQVAQLDNYFQDTCLTSQQRNIEDIDSHAAVIYTIELPGDRSTPEDRLEVILSLSDGTFHHHETIIDDSQFSTTVDTLHKYLVQPDRLKEINRLSHQVYSWLIQPLETVLNSVNVDIDTLVFVLDGRLQNLPMSALYDGHQYLIERYAIAITPGLRLLNREATPAKLNALTAGVSEPRANFPALKNVTTELNKIGLTLESKNLINEQFNRQNFTKIINSQPFSIVHLATHGQFSSNPNQTFILLWDRQLTIEDFSSLLQNRNLEDSSLIDLLVLSACETAKGDNRATLGLAGMSVRTGVSTTLATLWQVSDRSTTVLMDNFYQNLNRQPEITKAEALRLAQLKLKQETQQEWDIPLFWAAYTIVGNWL